MYKLQSPELLKVFKTLFDSVPAALKIMKLEYSAGAVVEFEEQGKVLECRSHPEMLIVCL